MFKNKKNVLIVGGGNIGSVIAEMLLKTNNYLITVLDPNPLPMSKDIKVITHIKNLKGILNYDLAYYCKHNDYVINAAPYNMSYKIAEVAIEAGCCYFDMTEDVKQTEKIKELEKKKNSKYIVTQSGLAPGYISIITNHYMKMFDEIKQVTMRVGALPVNISNKFKYNFTWSPEGVINEYYELCNIYCNKTIGKLSPLLLYETFGEYEAFTTSGGIGILPILPKVETMIYKSIRYKGHHKLLWFLIKELKLNKQQLLEILTNAIPFTTEDKVIIYVTITGKINGKFITKNYYNEIFYDNKYTAIQKATASGLCTIVEMARKNIITPGFVSHYDISYESFLEINKQFGNVYGKNTN